MKTLATTLAILSGLALLPLLALAGAAVPPYLLVPQPDGSVARYLPEPAAPATVPATVPTVPPVVIKPVPPPVVGPPKPPVTQPAWPKMAARTADAKAARRGDGLDLGKLAPGPDGVVSVGDLWVSGYRQNVVADKPGTYRLTNVRVLDAFRDDPGERNMGNGFFFGAKTVATLYGCAGIGNGWQPDKPPANRSDRRHAVYGYYGSDVTASWCLLACNAGAGFQAKGRGAIDHSLLVDNGFSIQGLVGPLSVRNCLVYDGHRWAQVDDKGKVTALTGDVGVSAYGPTTVDGLIVAGGPRQRLADLVPGVPSYNGPALNGSRRYAGNTDGYPAPAGAKWTVRGFGTTGWLGGAVGGDAPPPKPDVAYALPAGAEAKLAALVEQARTTERPIPDIVAEAFRVARVPWAK